MASQQARTRKRPAPGASPLSQTQSPSSPAFPQDQNLPLPAQQPTNHPYLNPYDSQTVNDYSLQALPQAQPNNQVARRTPNQPIVPIHNTSNGQWPVSERAGQELGQNGWAQYDDLDQRALAAKKDAESKRKQIPPFIQKLSSFLDESRNTDLICWSENGDSFHVLDEEQFAKTLIPELFKHSNYASFVRQLNMYGFHKRVGLSDNSMRASERKSKNPSEYSNPYFKRGRPNLLWLIQKPKSTSTKSKGGSRAKQEEYDEDVDETIGRENSPLAGNLDNFDDGTFRPRQQNLLTLGNNEPSQDQLTNFQAELQTIRNNQQKIATMLNEVRREHKQLYGQAKAFHDLHERHDQSINAILTFLATVYQKNINDGQGTMGDMFPNAVPSTEQNRGNIVDMGEVRDQSSMLKPFRRGPLLLEDKKSPSSLKPDTHLNTKSYPYSPTDQLQSPTIQELSDHSGQSTPSPRVKPDTKNDNAQIPQADFMSILNNASAKNNAFSPNAPMDFSEALSQLQNSGRNTPLTPGQRHNMLTLMGNEYQASDSDSNLNNALASYSASNGGLDPAAQFDATSNNLDTLGQIIREQNHNIENLSNTLTPLSPSGSIPGINSEVPYNLSSNPDMDFDNIFNTDSYFNENPGNTGGDFDFDGNFDFGDADNFGDSSIGNVSGGNTGVLGGDASAGAQEEQMDEGRKPAIAQAVEFSGEGTESPGKKRRIG